jgi:hypothetical protein
MTGEAYYFGCWEQAGHHFFTPGMHSVRGEVTPWGYDIDSQIFAQSDHWTLLQGDGWTAIGRRDNTVDSRPGSHSTFAFHADLSVGQAELEAATLFPEIFKRTGWATILKAG